MNNNWYLPLAIVVMALVTYLPRVIPLAVFRKKIKNPFVRSFLTYMPYGVLAAMIFPATFFSTPTLLPAVLGTLTALTLAFFRKGLLTVAIGATAVVFLTEQALALFA